MKDAIDRAAPCPTTIEAWLMKYAGRSQVEIEAMNGSFEEHCAARTVLSLRNAGAVFPDPTDKAFKSFKDAITQIQEKMPDGDAIANTTAAASGRRQREPGSKL